MEKLSMETKSPIGMNVEKIGLLFPHCVVEVKDNDGTVRKAIDFDKLKAELGGDAIEGPRERYQFTWPQKREAANLANTPTRMTLRPYANESVGKDGTSGKFDSENLYIEGDNLEVLKVLRETYLGKVKMIYIDPPYNTGKDFVYKDRRYLSQEEMNKLEGKFDEYGNALVANTDSNGRFHTDWLNMIYPRLKVARDLLSEDGVIFISMDDNEIKNLKAICDEIFGSQNFLAQVVWERSFSPINLMKHFSPSHDYILVYAKNQELAQCFGIPRSEEADNRYSNPDNDPRGPWMSSDISVGPAIEANIYPITTPSGRVVEPPAARSWSLSRNAFRERLADNRIWFGPNGDGVPRIKRFRSELRKTGITPMTIWKYTEVDHSQGATQKLANLFEGKKYFDYPKPVDLLKRCLALYTVGDCIVMDFFSGSGTFAQAVMELNLEDGSDRKYILIQAPEKMENPANVTLTFDTIPEFAEERIRRAGKKIKEEAGSQGCDIDYGFRVLKLDTSNMKDFFYDPSKITTSLFDDMADNVKDGRNDEDLLFQVMLQNNIPLSSSIEKEKINGHDIFNVNDGFMIATFDQSIDDDTIIEIAKREPVKFVMREPKADGSSTNPDNIIDNFEQKFDLYSPSTVRTII